MICEEITKMISENNDEAIVLFKIIEKKILAGYRVRDICVFYFLDWYNLVDGKLGELYMAEIPADYRLLQGCKRIILIGAFKDAHLSKKMIIINLVNREIIGFINIQINKWIKKVLSQITTKSIIEEIEKIYARWLMENRRMQVVTWYPIGKDRKKTKNLISVNRNSIKEVTPK